MFFQLNVTYPSLILYKHHLFSPIKIRVCFYFWLKLVLKVSQLINIISYIYKIPFDQLSVTDLQCHIVPFSIIIIFRKNKPSWASFLKNASSYVWWATLKSICFIILNNSLLLQVWMTHRNCFPCLLISVTSYHSLIGFNILWWDIPYILLTVTEKQGKTLDATWLLGIARMFFYYFAHGNTEGQKFHLLKKDSKIHLNL